MFSFRICVWNEWIITGRRSERECLEREREETERRLLRCPSGGEWDAMGL